MNSGPGTKVHTPLEAGSDTSDGAYQAGYTWCVNFEVPANREQAGATRGRTAQLKYWVRYGGTTSEFSASMDLNPKGYSGALSDWSSLGSSFYWETEEAQPESSVPVSTPSAAAPASAAPAEEEKQADSTAPSVRVPYVRVPHHAPVSAASGAVSREPPRLWPACSSAPESRPDAAVCRSRKKTAARSPVHNIPLGSAAPMQRTPDFLQKRYPYGRTKRTYKIRSRSRIRRKNATFPGPNGSLQWLGFS